MNQILKQLLMPTSKEVIQRLQEENKYLKEAIVEEKMKTVSNIKALNRALSEVKNDNSKLSKQIEDYVELKEHYSHLKDEGFI